MPNPFTEKVLAIIKSIPEGHVMTYGRIAACAGSPRGARQVVRALHVYGKKEQLPWQRVVDRNGKIAITSTDGYARQKELLESEGIKFDTNGTIDLGRYIWYPEE